MTPPQLAALLSAVQRIKTASIIAPLLALDVIAGAVALIATPFIPASLLLLPWMVFTACIAATLIAYLSFSIVDPNRLQTEDYQLAHHRIMLIGDERSPNDAKLIDAAPVANTQIEAR